jgi:hypothetical protein
MEVHGGAWNGEAQVFTFGVQQSEILPFDRFYALSTFSHNQHPGNFQGFGATKYTN